MSIASKVPQAMVSYMNPRLMRIRTFSELHLLIQTGAWVCVVRTGLWLVPFRRLRGTVTWLTRTVSKRSTPISVEEVTKAVSAVSRYVPRATCLTQALALHILLKRAGLQSRIQIGVSKEGGRFEAHAWVESQHRVVIGNDPRLERFAPMTVWD